jgi:CheY-like chemotaxis protein
VGAGAPRYDRRVAQDLRTVLVVDDDESIRDALRAVLDRGRFRVVRAATSSHAVAAMHGIHVDIVVIDLTMPDADAGRFLDGRAAVPELALTPAIAVASSRDAEVDADPRLQAVVRWPAPLSDLVRTIVAWSDCAPSATHP